MSITTADFLLIDNSNSFTKFALSTRDKVGPSRKLRTSVLDAAGLKNALFGWRWQVAVLSSVVPSKGEVIADFLSPAPVVRVGAKTKLGVGIDYPQPKTIGADRLANAAGAFCPVWRAHRVVDFGTAVSFDIVPPREITSAACSPPDWRR